MYSANANARAMMMAAPPMAQDPSKDEDDTGSSAGIVAATEMIYRFTLLVRSFLAVFWLEAFIDPFEFKNHPNFYLLHEVFRLYPGLYPWHWLFNRNGLQALFIAPYLVYGMLLIALSIQLWAASSQEGMGTAPTGLSSVRLWIYINSFLLVAELAADTFGLFWVIHKNSIYGGHNPHHGAVPGKTFVVIELMISFLCVGYQGVCIKVVSSFKSELEQRYEMFGLAEPSEKMDQVKVVQPVWGPNLHPQQPQYHQMAPQQPQHQEIDLEDDDEEDDEEED